MIFIGSSLTLVFGVLNLIATVHALVWCRIGRCSVSACPGCEASDFPCPAHRSRGSRCQVAVVVDTFADARLNDVQNLAEEMEDEIEHDSDSAGKSVKGLTVELMCLRRASAGGIATFPTLS